MLNGTCSGVRGARD